MFFPLGLTHPKYFSTPGQASINILFSRWLNLFTLPCGGRTEKNFYCYYLTAMFNHDIGEIEH